MSFAEIGAIVGQPEGTVRTSCHRALHKLRQRLSDWVIDKTVEAHEDPTVVVKA
jgi:DNA-directed RNA polymerase specialized sigma24 family protein